MNVTITGLPRIAGFGGGSAGPLALNQIAPAAGGGGEEGQGSSDLANIEPAAGGEDVACWGDAVGAAGGGTSVSYSFGGSFEESLADAVSCGSQSF